MSGGEGRPAGEDASSGQGLQVGDHNVQVNIFGGSAAVPLPAGVNVPPGLENLPELPGLFVGPGAELERLETALAGGGDVVVQAVHGLGGIGKSTLAARYAATRRAAFDLIWWVTADSPAAIETGLARLASRLLPGLGELVSISALRDWALGWLASHGRWLVVLDNVTDPAHVKALLAQAPSGRFVITSRRAADLQPARPPSCQEPAELASLPLCRFMPSSA